MPKCRNCNAENSLNQSYCKMCNAPLIQDNQFECPGCKLEIHELAQECPNCGLTFSFNFKSVKKPAEDKLRRVMGGQIEFRQPKITYMDTVEEATKQHIIEHYNELSKTLNVMPKLVVHPAGKKLKHLFHAYYHKNNIIEVVNDDLIIATLAHEMRHVYQVKFKQKMYYQTYITNAKEYAESSVEIDARSFAISYCESKELKGDVAHLKMQEIRIQAFLSGQCSAKDAGIDEPFLRLNPTIPKNKVVAQQIQRKMQGKKNTSSPRNKNIKTIIIGGILVIFLLIGIVSTIIGLF